MVDTRDLKSLGQKCPCGFDSRLRHKKKGSGIGNRSLFFSRVNSIQP